MLPMQREALAELLTSMRAGRLTRRSFVERSIGLGLASSASGSLLEACGGISNSATGNGAATHIVWQSEQDSTGTYQSLVNTFNQTVGNHYGVFVLWQQGPSNPDDILMRYNNLLRARSASVDVLSIDIVYPPQFASSGWIRPITDRQWPLSERQKYLPGPITACTYQNSIVAAPFRTDVGLLYYRTDLLSSPPTTWSEMVALSHSHQANSKYGYVWQGAQYEGLVCNFVELLRSYGGDILSPADPHEVLVNSAQAHAALAEMVSWVGSISPPAVITYMEDQSRLVWQNGDAIFMRNWPYAYALSNDPSQSRIVHRFGIASLPTASATQVSHSTIGGWNLAMNAFSTHSEQAWLFIHYMLQPAAQKLAAINASQTVTLQSIYDDPIVLKKEPLFATLKPILQRSEPRPVSPKYSDVSAALQRNIYRALSKQATPTDALTSLYHDLKAVVSP